MAASTSRQPHDIPLPSSPDTHPKSGKKVASRKGKGKGKEHHQSPDPAQAVNTSWDDVASDSGWEWASLTESAASNIPPIFTKDGSYFFSLAGSSVKVHSVVTGSAVSTLSLPEGNGTASLLTCAILNPHNAFQLVTGSLDGRLMVWDFLDATLLKVIDLAQPIHHICAHADIKDCIFVAATRSSRKTKTNSTDTNAVVLRVSLRTVGNTTKSAEIQPIGKTRHPTGLTFSSSGAWLIATAGNKVYVAMSSAFTSGFTKYVSPERLTCLAFHPTEDYFATGDVKGNIRIWYCLNESLPVNVRGVEKKTQTTTLHWHAHAVSSIAFTPNGAYLLSGGEESVLVIWQLRTGQKEFVPRVGAPINTVAISRMGSGEEEYLLGLADATYLFVSAATLKISRSYSRIKLAPAVPYNQPTTSARAVPPLAIHALTSSLILPSSHPSSLQVYSPLNSKLLYELEVSPSNKISRRDEKPLEPCYIEHTSISTSGDWFASVDYRDRDDGIRCESHLKIWQWNRKADRWILNTRIDRPHGLHKITCLSFSPSLKEHQSIRLVSTGEDGNVKIWGLRAAKDRSGGIEEFWIARSTFCFRSEIPRSASWSTDGSLLAISIGPFIAVYDPAINSLRQTFTSPECQKINSAHFIGKGGRYLVVVGDHDLVLWDVVTLYVRWHYKTVLTIAHVVGHPQEDSFTAFLDYALNSGHQKDRTRGLIFQATSSSPSSIHSLPFTLRNLSLYMLSCAPSKYTFIGITHEWNVVLFGDEAKLIKEGSTAKEITLDSSSSRRSLFQDIFGKSAFTVSPNVPALPMESPARSWTGKEAVEVFDSPVYTMPPLGTLYDPIINSLLKPRLENIRDNSMGPGDEDAEMDDEDVNTVLASTRRLPRIVSREEVEAFIELFRKHSILSSPQSKANGHSDVMKNGKSNVFHPLMTSAASTPLHGSVSQVKTFAIMDKGTMTPESISSPSAMIVNGRKRKKASS